MLPGMYISTPIRKSITRQIVTAYRRRTGAHMISLAQSVAVQGSVDHQGDAMAEPARVWRSGRGRFIAK
jgi:hypothetical protein